MIEICCGSYEDARNAYLGGAKQIELNSALHLGGLTPSVASLILTKKNTDLKVICMVRPRGAGFCYNDVEFEQMIEEAKMLLENGADGLAFGFLNLDYTIDVDKTKIMVDLIKSYKKEAVFHRAFDCVKEPLESIEKLIELKIDRLLTSGLKAKAMDGKELIKKLQENYGDKIQILAGSGLNASNVNEIKEYTGINMVHSSCKAWKEDITTSGDDVNYCYGTDGNENSYDYVSKQLVEKLVSVEK